MINESKNPCNYCGTKTEKCNPYTCGDDWPNTCVSSVQVKRIVRRDGVLTMPKIKVRIAVAVDPNTLEWNSCGWGGGKIEPGDSEKMSFAVETVPDGERRYWVEAEINVEPEDVIAGTSVVA